MNIFTTILAVIGSIALLYWLLSLFVGMTADKKALGENWIKKKLKAAGINAAAVDPELITKIAKSAHLTSIGSGPNYGRYDAHTFKSDLDFKSKILIRHLLGGSLNDDEKFLIGLLEDLPHS